MHFTTEALDRLITIYEHQFDEPITRDEAAALAGRLVHLYRLFLRPLPSPKAEEEEVPQEG
jgi:hypothetical protein